MTPKPKIHFEVVFMPKLHKKSSTVSSLQPRNPYLFLLSFFILQPAMTNSKSSGDNGFESSDGWEVEDEVEIPNGNGEADNNNMEANFEAICDTARYVLSGLCIYCPQVDEGVQL